MAIFKCKMCGGDLNVQDESTVCECEYCGTKQTIPVMNNEKKVNLFNRANRLRYNCEFDKAAGVYESIVAEFSDESEAYWGLCLCKYGIEYVDDPTTAKKIPTCHRTSYDSIFQDNNFELACEYADSVARQIYRAEAKEIERLQKEILEIVKNEEPFDIFICYKETAPDGQRTKDSVLAQDIYDALTDKGYKVFFARITLEDKLGQDYEPYIFSALNSAKVMLAIGTDYECFNAVWVKNEWSRFLALMSKDKSKTLIPCYCDIDAYDMPEEFRRLQGQDMGRVGSIQDLVHGIGKIMPQNVYVQSSTSIPQPIISTSLMVESLLKRAFIFLNDREWSKANEYFEKVLDIDPECGKAYLGKIMTKCEISDLNNPYCLHDPLCLSEIRNTSLYEKVVKYGDKEAIESLNKIINNIIDLNASDSIVIPDGVTSIGEEAFQNIFFQTIKIPNSVTTIFERAFYKCTNLTSIIMPDSLTGIYDGAFAYCESLKTITIPNGITKICPRTFEGCKGLTSITIPTGVTKIDKWAFLFCENLTSIYIPDSVTEIGESAFAGCTKLTSITIPNSVEVIGNNAFKGCSSLTSITIPNCVKKIEYSTFEGCTSLASFFIPNSVTTIQFRAFSDCVKLKSINIPDGVAEIDGEAFLGCIGLTTIKIPNSVTTISADSFKFCYNLNVVIPDHLYSIMAYKSDYYGIKLVRLSENMEQHQEDNKRRIEKVVRHQAKDEEKALKKERTIRRLHNLCQYCGGSFRGLFSKKCTICGKVKDY